MRYEKTIAQDPNESWEYPFDDIARAKAELCWRTGKPSGYVLHRTPWLLQEGDARYAGGVVRDGLVVAISGFPSHIDEMLSWVLFSVIAGLCADSVAKIKQDPYASDFIGGNNLFLLEQFGVTKGGGKYNQALGFPLKGFSSF